MAIASAVVFLCVALFIVIGAILSIVKPCDPEIEPIEVESVKSYISTRNICLTPTCIHVASHILKSMDTSVNPCDNFYKFACGNFLEEVSIPDDKMRVDSFDKTNDNVLKQLRKIIETPLMQNEPRFSRIVKIFYKSCMDQRSIAARKHEPLLTMLKKLGGWPVLEGATWNENDFHWTKLTYKLREEGLSTNHYIDLVPFLDSRNVSRTILYIVEPTFLIPHKILAAEESPEILIKYQKFMVDIAVLLGAQKEIAEEELTAAHEFEKKLAIASLKSDYRGAVSLKVIKSYHLMTLETLSEKHPSIPWKEYINRFIAPEISAEENELINVEVSEYISKLEEIIEQVPKRVQANYIMWRIVVKSIHYLTEDLRKKHFEFFSTTIGLRAKEERWKECMNDVTENLPIGMGIMYVRRYVPEVIKTKVTEMFNYLKVQMNIRLQRVPWMDPRTRIKAIRKILAMQSHIAYPDEFLDDKKIDKFFQGLRVRGGHYWENSLNITRFNLDDAFARLREPFNRSEWRNHGDVASINAFYSRRENSFSVVAGILQMPFFDEKQPQYVNYGGIGFVMGHEITHGFDSTGRYYGPDGSVFDWWTSFSRQKFDRQIRCIVDQYNNYSIPEVSKNLDGDLTRDENIADNGGVKLSYLAYKKWASMHRREQVLPGLDYTQSQLFWISTANLLCTNYRLDLLKWNLKNDVHSPTEFRIIGSLSNTIEFAKDFQCPKGTMMNPRRKCATW